MSKISPTPRPLLPLWAAILVAGAAALSMYLAYPRPAVWGLAFVAVALLLVALIGRRVGGALLIGAVYALLFFGLLLSWTSRYLGPIPWSALTVVEGGLTALGLVPIVLAYRWIPRAVAGTVGRLLILPAVVAALWSGLELLIGSWPYGGFPWARIGTTQAESPTAAIVSWVGVSGLSFLMVFLVSMLIEVIRAKLWITPLRLVPPALLTAVLAFTPLFPTSSTGTMRIGAVQGNGPSGYFDERAPYGIISAQVDATADLYEQDVDLVVWPEGLDSDPYMSGTLARQMTRVAARADAPLLANAATERKGLYYNTSMLWLQDGTAEQKYDKHNPVPFGEYVPNRDVFYALVPDLIGLIQREYTPGTSTPVITVDRVKVGLAICFDVIYDDIVGASIGSGAQVLVFQTNNADFRGTDENLQQLAIARLRAIETGRSVVNVSTVGTSQIIRPDGSTALSLGAGESGVLVEDVELREGVTAGVALGPWVQQVLLWGGLVGLGVAGWRARRAR